MNRKPKTKNESGFIALMAVIVISAVLLSITFSVSAGGYFTRFNVLNGEFKRISLGLAESCVDVALLKIGEQYTTYTGNETIPVGTQNCKIDPITYAPDPGGNPNKKIASISTTASYEGAFSSMQISATAQNPAASPIFYGTITVVTHVINDSGGVKQAGDFTMSAPGGTPNSFAGSESGVFVYVNPGSYSVTEAGMSGYRQSASAGCAGTVLSAQNKVCTFINDDMPTSAKLTVIANFTNDNGGTKQPSDASLTLDGVSVVSGQTVTLTPGTHTASGAALAGYSASPWGYNCAGNGSITLAAGDNKTCIINYDDDPPPSLGDCADTVMILSTGMSFPDRQNEGTAAKTLLDLYRAVAPIPYAGVGSFGGLDGADASVPDGSAASQFKSGLLTNVYGNKSPASGLYSTINAIAGLNSSGHTNISLAITVGNNELNSSRHIAGHKMVLVLVSDGKPNRPSTNDQLPLNAADTAKLGGTDIYTVHFGTLSGRDLVAHLASGNVPVPGHQDGSANDQATPAAENADGDHFFISPSSADMPAIFDTIARLACPAINNPPPPPPPTTATVAVITRVVNDNGGTAQPSDFTMNISATNPSQSAFAGVDSPGVNVIVSPGSYSVDEASFPGYTKNVGGSCSGSVVAGETVTCVITNDDLPPPSPPPPPPPPPPPNIAIDAWHETP